MAVGDLVVDVDLLTPAQADGVACVLCGEACQAAAPVGWCAWHGVRWCQVFACADGAGCSATGTFR